MDRPANQNFHHAQTALARPAGPDSLFYFGSRHVDPAMVRLVCGLVLALVFFSLVLFRPQGSLNFASARWYRSVPVVEAGSADELMDHLQSHNLWNLPENSLVSPLLVQRLPSDFPFLDMGTQKQAFLHTLLPVAMVALAEVEEERQTLERILAGLRVEPAVFLFDSEDDENPLKELRRHEVRFLEYLCRKYRTCDVELLRHRVNPVPVSLIMAQAALESSWGGSRFALEGNNLFGIWTWNGDGMVPAARENGKSHRVAAYPSLLDSVRSYILMLNRGHAYASFRKIRQESMDSLRLANGLLRYSERRHAYVAEVAGLIRSNRLQKYDQLLLAGFPSRQESRLAWRSVSLQ